MSEDATLHQLVRDHIVTHVPHRLARWSSFTAACVRTCVPLWNHVALQTKSSIRTCQITSFSCCRQRCQQDLQQSTLCCTSKIAAELKNVLHLACTSLPATSVSALTLANADWAPKSYPRSPEVLAAHNRKRITSHHYHMHATAILFTTKSK